MTECRVNYFELPATDLPRTNAFYEKAFDWKLTSYGPTYAATSNGIVDVGLQGDRAEIPQTILPVIGVADLEAALAAVQSAGGEITKAIFSYPGGRRFHFRDPSGNQLAVSRSE
jgi:predicted enzyme related to lactoylglutathione lyase